MKGTFTTSQPFSPSDEEQTLYDDVSEWLRREDSIALPPGQRGLLTMVLRKLLASSTFAIAATLRKLVVRLAGEMPASGRGATPDAADFADDYEGVAELAEEWPADPTVPTAASAAVGPGEAQDRIDAERNRLLDGVEAALQGRVERRRVLVVRWRMFDAAYRNKPLASLRSR